jgi:integrase
MTLYSTGLRRAELCRLKVADVDSKRVMLRVVQGKGGIDREVPLSKKLLGALREYYRWILTSKDDRFMDQAISYDSCRNRHSPKCQAQARQRWLDAREKELLEVPYFHVVFTLPHELNPLKSSQRPHSV